MPRLPAIYTRIRYLNAGGFGSVYAAFDTSLGRDVAVKVVRYDSESPETYLRPFEREVKLMKRVRPPAPMPMFIRADLDWPRPHYAMDLIEGSGLHSRIENRGPLTEPAEIAKLFDTVAALVELQSLDILHRDITPKNVMINDDRAVLIDLGIGREMDSTSTRTAALTGVAEYMAPEVLTHGWDYMTLTSEVYSWGATLAYAVTGMHRYKTSMQAASEKDDPAFVGALADVAGRSPWHRELVNLIANCMVRTPAQRITDAEDLACVVTALRSMVRMNELGRLTPDNAANILAKRTIRNVSDQVFARVLEVYDHHLHWRDRGTYLDDPVKVVLTRLERIYPARELMRRGASAPLLNGLIVERFERSMDFDDIYYKDSHSVPSKWLKSLAEVGITAEQTSDGLIRLR